MSKEAKVGRAMYDFKDLLMTNVCNKLVESLHKNCPNVTPTERNLILSDVQNEVELLFNNATDMVLRQVRD